MKTWLALLAAAGMLGANLYAGTVTMFMNNARDFPAADGNVPDIATGTLTPSTMASHSTSFTDPSTGNTFNGLDTIQGSPFQMSVSNAVTINQTTNSSTFNFISFAVSNVTESGVTVTGGSGTAFLLPTFRLRGSFNVGNPNLFSSLDSCDGNGSCDASTVIFDAGGSQPQNVNVLYTPPMDSTTSFTFGSPFSMDWELDTRIEILNNGSQANPGGPVVSNFTLTLDSIRVVNADGSTIPGVQINSQLVNMALPEPGTAALGVVVILLAAVARRAASKTSGS